MNAFSHSQSQAALFYYVIWAFSDTLNVLVCVCVWIEIPKLPVVGLHDTRYIYFYKLHQNESIGQDGFIFIIMMWFWRHVCLHHHRQMGTVKITIVCRMKCWILMHDRCRLCCMYHPEGLQDTVFQWQTQMIVWRLLFVHLNRFIQEYSVAFWFWK